jgi:hypothetical protein
VERPDTVRAGIGAFIATLILGLIASILTFGRVDELVARQVRRAAPTSS